MSQVNKEDHGFNWVKARQDCSLELEFVRLSLDVQRDIKERQAGLKQQQLKARLDFQAGADDYEFTVIRTGSGSPRCVSFTLQRDMIVVTKNQVDNLHLTLTFTDNGECRFRVNGKGEYLRWQVSIKSLEEIFFYGLFEKESQ